MEIITRTKFHLGRRGSIIMFFLVGVLFLAVGIYLLSNTARMSSNGLSTQAEVVNIKATHNSKKKIEYTPEIRFTTAEGERVNTKLDKTTRPPAYSVGDEVKIIYTKDKPTDILVDSVFNRYAFPALFVILGIVSLFAGVFEVIRGRQSF